MSSPAEKRLSVDLRKIKNDPPPGVSAGLEEDNLFIWKAVISGPVETPYENGVFKLRIEFQKEYPIEAPSLQFLSDMFHPNIYTDGRICMDILDKNWTPTYDVCAILSSVQALLDKPNPGDAANTTAGNLYTENRAEFNKRVIETVEQSWSDGK